MDKINLNTPYSDECLKKLNVGDNVLITGEIYTARDAAHKKLVEMIEKGEELPLDISGKIVYYAGPCPNRPEHVIGSIGPTTSGRMDAYSPLLIKSGLKVMIGKGLRNDDVIDVIKTNGGIYFVAIGGCGALLSKCVKKVEIVAFDEFGTEAIRKLHVENFPVIVAIDTHGRNIYEHL